MTRRVWYSSRLWPETRCLTGFEAALGADFFAGIRFMVGIIRSECKGENLVQFGGEAIKTFSQNPA